MSEPESPKSEQRFTKPTILCPHPERWTSTDIDSTEIEVAELVYGFVRALQPDFCVETGTGFGQVAEEIGDALLRNGHGRLVTLEPDPARVPYCRERLAGKPVTVVASKSLDWKPDEVIDFAWFDSYFRLRVPEYAYFRPYMRRGTIVGFHDTAPGHGGDSFVGDDTRSALGVLSGQVRMIHLPTPRGVTFAEVL